MGIKKYGVASAATLALGLFFTPPVSIAIDAITNTVAPLVSAAIGNLGFISPAMGQPGALTKKQLDALSMCNAAVKQLRVDPRPAARTDQFERAAAEPAGTSALPCTHQHDEHIQGPHRRSSVQNRKAQ